SLLPLAGQGEHKVAVAYDSVGRGEVRPGFCEGPVGFTPAATVEAVGVVAPGEFNTAAIPAVVLNPVHKHMDRQNAVVPVANPLGNVRGPEIEAQLRRVHQFASLPTRGRTNHLTVDQPADLVRRPFQGEGVIAVAEGRILRMNLLGGGAIAE